MNAKILAIMGSVRFWLITLATLSLLAGHYMPNLVFLFDTISAWLATVAGIGTIDKLVQPKTPSA